jgi:phospholipid-binding lipoprotein MlaA
MSSCHVTPIRFRTLRRLALLAVFTVVLPSCATNSQTKNGEADGKATETEAAASASGSIHDPFEPINRKIFAFNYRLDRWVLKPVARGYRDVAPKVVQLGVTNFFSNLREVTNTANNILQWKWGQAANDSGRFVINSTIGLAGLFDVAAKAGLPRSQGEDFGQTLAVWGVDSGPYLMLPLLGPANVRDGFGMWVDRYGDPVTYVDPNRAEYGLRAVDIVDRRAQLLDAESLITGDNYTLLRDFYLQRRKYLINDGAVEDDFGSSYGDDEYYDDYESDY